MAAKLAAGDKLPPEAETPSQPGTPAAGAEAAGTITLDEDKLGWIRIAMGKVEERKRVVIALSEETTRDRMADIIARARTAGTGGKAELGVMPAGFASRTGAQRSADRVVRHGVRNASSPGGP